MKRCLVILFAIGCILSCNDAEKGQSNDRHVDKLYCEFLSVDAYSTEIRFEEVSDQSRTNLSYIMGLQLKGHGNDFTNQYRIDDDSVAIKEQKLADSLSFYLFRYDVGVDTYLKMIYGGISGPVRVYADKDVYGRSPGDNLADLFVIYTTGIVSYPEMSLLVDEHIQSNRGKGQADFYEIGFGDYFSEGAVPFCVDCGTYLHAKEGYSHLIDGSVTVHFEIPITGIDLNGREKSVVLTGVIGESAQD